MVQLLTDEHFVEGILGGLGAFLAISVKQVVPNVNPLLLATIGFMSVWFIRKIGMNLYKEQKKRQGRGVSSLNVNAHPGVLAGALLVTLFYLLRPSAAMKNLKSTGSMVWIAMLLSLGYAIFLQR
jgi:hypothetical protein